MSTDAVTKSYFDEKLPVIIVNICDFNGYRLSNISYPEKSTDDVNKEFIINEIENKLFKTTNNNGGDFNNLRLVDVPMDMLPKDMTDAVNKEYLLERLSLFRNNLYRILHNIYMKKTNDNPIQSKVDWVKEYL